MKILTPPQITSLDGLLELVLQPQKMIDYLMQLKTMRDAIIESIQAYDTVAKANLFLSQATAKHEEALSVSSDATEMLAQATNDVAAMKAALDKEKAQWESERKQQHKALVARETEIQNEKYALQVATTNLSAREGELQAKQAALIVQQSSLAAQQEKITKAHATLAELRG